MLLKNLNDHRSYGAHKISTPYEGKHQKRKELSFLFLHATCLLSLIHKPTKYYQNISKHAELWRTQVVPLKTHKGE